MRFIIDRLENNFAVVELDTGKIVNVPMEILPYKAKEGSVIDIICNETETKKREEKIKIKMNRLFKNKQKGKNFL